MSDRLSAWSREFHVTDGYTELLALVGSEVTYLSIYTVHFSRSGSFAEISPSEHQDEKQFTRDLRSRGTKTRRNFTNMARQNLDHIKSLCTIITNTNSPDLTTNGGIDR